MAQGLLATAGMRTSTIFLLLTLLSGPASAQFGNVIHHVAPNHGDVSGGTRVVITGDFSLEPIISPPCFGAEVYIGGRIADVISFSPERVEVETRAYTPGRFDVIVDRCGIRAERENGYVYGDLARERMLLPVVLVEDLPGAFGSIWRTEVVGVNPSSGQRVTSVPRIPCNDASCEGSGGGRFIPVFPQAPTPGRLLYVEGFEVEDVHVTLRVRDVSRAQETLGTELPVVSEDETFGPREFFSIPDVPSGSPFRRKLRLYRVDTAEPADLVVRFVGSDGSFPAEQTITLTGGLMDGTFLIRPPYAELDLDALGFGGDGSTSGALMINTPAEGLFWGFLTVTNDVTQQITTVTP